MRYIIITLFCFISVYTFSQIAPVRGIPNVIERSTFLLLSDSGYISIKKEESKADGKGWNSYRNILTLIRYDKHFKAINQAKLSGGANIYSAMYSELRQVGGKVWLFYLEGQDGDDVGDIKAAEVNTISLSLADAKTIISKAELNQTLRGRGAENEMHFMVRVSPSGRYFCFYARTFGRKQNLAVLDKDLNRVWGKQESFEFGNPYSEWRGLHSLEVDDNGGAYFSFKLRSDVENYVIYSPTGKSIVKSIDLGGGSAKEILFAPEKNGGPVFAYGTYMEGDYCKGVYKAEVKANGDLTAIVKTAFPASLIEPLSKEGWAKRRRLGVDPVFNASLVKNGDGSTCFVAEIYAKIDPYYHIGSIMYARFSSTGQPVFGRAPKYWAGYGVTRYYFDGEPRGERFFDSFPYESKIIFFYFDNPDNITRDISLDAKVVTPSNGALIAAIIDADGSIKRQQITTLPLNYLSVSGTTATPGFIQVPLVVGYTDVLAKVKIE